MRTISTIICFLILATFTGMGTNREVRFVVPDGAIYKNVTAIATKTDNGNDTPNKFIDNKDYTTKGDHKTTYNDDKITAVFITFKIAAANGYMLVNPAVEIYDNKECEVKAGKTLLATLQPDGDGFYSFTATSADNNIGEYGIKVASGIVAIRTLTFATKEDGDKFHYYTGESGTTSLDIDTDNKQITVTSAIYKFQVKPEPAYTVNITVKKTKDGKDATSELTKVPSETYAYELAASTEDRTITVTATAKPVVNLTVGNNVKCYSSIGEDGEPVGDPITTSGPLDETTFTFFVVADANYTLPTSVTGTNVSKVTTGTNYSGTTTTTKRLYQKYQVTSLTSTPVAVTVGAAALKTYAITGPTGNFTYQHTDQSGAAITGDGLNKATHGEDFFFKITPTTGYEVASAGIVFAGATVTKDGDIYKVSNVTEEKTITITSGIQKKTYAITLKDNATPGGDAATFSYTDVTGLTSGKVEHGSDFSFKITPATGYEVASAGIVFNGATVTKDGDIYKVSNVTEEKTITITSGIQKKTYEITAGTGNYAIKQSDGTSFPNPKPKVEHGTGEFKFKVEPSTGYHVTAVAANPTANGTVSAADANKVYTLSNVTGALTLNATVAVNEYTVTLKDGGTKFNYKVNGSVVSSGTIKHLSPGNTYTFTIEAKDKYTLGNIVVSSTKGSVAEEGTGTATSRTYILSDVTANTDITVTGVTDPLLVTLNPETGVIYTAEDNTTISGDQPVIKGNNFTFKIKAAEGYELDADVKVTAENTDGDSEVLIANNGIYTLQGVNKDGWFIFVEGVTKLASTEPNSPSHSTLTITLTDVEGITLLPGAGTHSATVGGSFTFYLALAPGYEGMTPQATINGDPITLTLRPGGTEWMYTIPMVYDDMRVSVAFSTTANQEITTARIYGHDGLLYVEALQPGTLRVYAASGQQVVARRIADGLTTITLPRGNYIVVLDNTVQKINIK